MVKEKQKLEWLGVKRPTSRKSEIEKEFSKLQTEVGDFSTFQSELSSVSTESDFKNYLTNNNFSSQEADDFIEKINNNFEDKDGSGSSYDEFKDYIINTASTYAEAKSKFGSQASVGTTLETEDGDRAGGIRTFDNSGVTKDGVSVPAGAVEIFGSEIHTSKSDAVKTGKGSGSTGDSSSIKTDNIQTDDADNDLKPGNSIKISADVTNNGSYTEWVVVSLREDEETIKTKNISLDSSETKNISFTVTKTTYTGHDYHINEAGPVTVYWTPKSL